MANKKYSYKNVDMLSAAKTLVSNFKDDKQAFIAVRPLWADPFIEDFEKQVNLAFETCLGMDPKKNLKLATQNLLGIQADALADLSLFKVSLESDFASDPAHLKWMLSTFGFTAHYKAVQNKDQESLVELLQKFNSNMNAELKDEITEKGTSLKLIEDIQKYAAKMVAANASQEALKGTTKQLTQKAQEEYDDIYTTCMIICKIGTRIFKDDKVKKNKFVFKRLVSKMNTYGSKEKEQPSEDVGVV